MAKASSPIRLQADLMQTAMLTGKRYHRSTAEQIEYWADIGKQVADTLDPDTLLLVSSGLARIRIEPVTSKPVNPGKVFQALEYERNTGTLSQSVTGSVVCYQVSESHPGYLEQVDEQGKATIGQFKAGEFIALADKKR